MPIESVPAARFEDAALADLFTRGYEDYFVPVHVDGPTFRAMMDLWDVSLEASRVLLDDGVPVAFAMLGVRAECGWIGGMGVVAAARGRGLGARVLGEVTDEARRRGLARVDLEVLVQNQWAIPVYERAGFRITRRLEVFERPAGPLPSAGAAPRQHVEEVSPALCFTRHESLHALERLPWQRALAVQRRLERSLMALAVRGTEGPACAVLVHSRPGRTGLLDVGVSAAAPAGALEAVLGEAVARHGASPLALVNLDSGHPAARPLRELGFAVSHAQHEMSLAW